jgi:molecular chaperone DnaK
VDRKTREKLKEITDRIKTTQSYEGKTIKIALVRSMTIGIDLGTSFTKVAIIDKKGQPRVIVNCENLASTPTALRIAGEKVLIGRKALKPGKELLDESSELYQEFRRLIGEPNNQITLCNELWAPEKLIGLFLRKIITDMQQSLGHKRHLTHAAITIPALFNAQQRGAIRQAGQMAGLEVIGLISEPMAVALAYWYKNPEKNPDLADLPPGRWII